MTLVLSHCILFLLAGQDLEAKWARVSLENLKPELPDGARSYIQAPAGFKSWPITVGDSPSYFKRILPTSRKRGRSDTSHKKICKCFAGVKTTPLGRLATISQQGGKL